MNLFKLDNIIIDSIQELFSTSAAGQDYLLWVTVTLGCLAASTSSQPGHHGVSTISNNLHDPGCY